MTTAATPLAGTYTADPVHSSFGFAVRYQGVSIFRGTLDEVAGDARRRPARGHREGRVDLDPHARAVPRPRAQRRVLRRRQPPRGHVHLDRRSTSARTAPRRVDGRADDQGHHAARSTPPAPGSRPAADAFGNTRGHLNLEAVIDRTEWDINWNMPLPDRRQRARQRRHADGRALAGRAGVGRCGSSASPAACAEDPTTASCSGRRATRSRPGSSLVEWDGPRRPARVRRGPRDRRRREPVRAFLDAIDERRRAADRDAGVQRVGPGRAQERARLGVAAVPGERAALTSRAR